VFLGDYLALNVLEENHGLLSGTDSVKSSINQALTLC
jgi:hypothetical protein